MRYARGATASDVHSTKTKPLHARNCYTNTRVNNDSHAAFLISKTFTLAGSFVSVFSLSQHLFKLASVAVNSIL
jgi:hypothetical protein